MKDFCGNCNSEIKQTLLTTVARSDKRVSAFINEFTENKSVSHCTKCYKPLLEEGKKNFFNLKNKCEETITQNLKYIPIITLHTPLNWDYEVIEMITSQSVTGTGLIAEIASDWTDFFGSQSNTYNKKIKEGEERCKNQLRVTALKIGANAIIGTDIDYSEAGGGKGMLMVCISGTAIRLKNPEVLKSGNIHFEEMLNASKKLDEIGEIDIQYVSTW
jgi:uncharacterized protein YbjQ (UPF0145 family)